MNSKRASTETSISDDGYGSDRPKSPETRIYEIDFQLQNQEFKEKYLVEKLLNNSANGVIYSGTVFKLLMQNWSISWLYFTYLFIF